MSIVEPTIAERYPEGDVWRSSVANARGYALLGFEVLYLIVLFGACISHSLTRTRTIDSVRLFAQVSKGRRAFLVTSDAMRGEVTGSTPHREAPEQHQRSKKVMWCAQKRREHLT